jgi:hypothetical protein
MTRTNRGYAVTVDGAPRWWCEITDRRDATATRAVAERDAEHLRRLRPWAEASIAVVECARPEGFA